jgi:glucose-6-phosphate isomerase
MAIENRSVKDLKSVLFDKEWVKDAPNFEVYSVQRGVKFEKGWRDDETLIYPRRLGREFPKTFGHEHPRGNRELIKVLKGEAVFLLQKDQGDKIKDIYFVVAQAGQTVVSPAGYSHATINRTKKILKIGTRLKDKTPSHYHHIKKHQGFGYYYTVDGWQKNPNYKRVPELREKSI